MKSAPDYVSGKKAIRGVASDRTSAVLRLCDLPAARRTPTEWAAPILIRTRRKSPHPDNRPRSSAFAFALRAEMEAQLLADVKRADDERRAKGSAVPFGRLCDAYRDRLQRDGKRYDRDRYRIDALEKFFGWTRRSEGSGLRFSVK